MLIDLLEAFGLEPKIINILKSKYGIKLFPLQVRAFTEYHILGGGNFLVNGVTSSGKTLIGEIIALHHCTKGKRVFYLVPTKALAEEKFEQFHDDYKKVGIQTVISSRDHREYDERIVNRRFHIAVIVYEKLHSLLVVNPKLMGDVGLVLVDELQYLFDEERGPILEVLLTRILMNPKQPQLVGLSAVLRKSEMLAQWLQAKTIREDKRPVELRRGVFFDGKFRYREFNNGNNGEEDWFQLKSEREEDQYVETAKFLAEEKAEQTIIFLSDKPATETLAHRLCRVLNLPAAAGAIAEMKTLEESVSRDMLLSFLHSGVAVHNADLSREERDIIERYARKGEIRVLCTATTLAVGLNLPMKNAIIEPLCWKYFRDTRSFSRERILVSDYKNMSGRVARYGFVSDFGRAVFVTASYVDYRFYYDHYIKGPVEDMRPTLKRQEMDRHILNLIASAKRCGEDEIKSFLKRTFTARNIWNTEMTDAAYDQIVANSVNICMKENLIIRADSGTLIVTELGNVVARSGVALDTAAFFMKFLHKSDPCRVSELEILLLLSLCRDSRDQYLSLRRSESYGGGYREDIMKIIRETGEEDKPLFQSLWALDHLLLDDKERAAKKTLMMADWLSSARTKDIEQKYQVFSGVIKRVGEDFSWLAETLASLARAAGWPEQFIMRIVRLSQRLIHGVTEKGLALSLILVHGLSRTYINRLITEGYDTSEAIADLPLTELVRLLPKRLAERLYRHFHRNYPVEEVDMLRESAAGVCEAVSLDYAGGMSNQSETRSGGKRPVVSAAPSASSSAPAAATTAATTMTTITTETTTAASEISFPHLLADILQNKGLLLALRTRLADTHDLRELIADPPTIFADERQQLFFYRGIPIKLQPACFHYLLLLAEKPKQIVARDEIYRCLWPGPMNYDGSNKPYDRQISDHKRRCVAQIKKSITGKIEMAPGELEALIITRPKVGYMLNLRQEEVLILKVR
jgi:helicase